MNIKDQLKAQSQQVATGRQNYADFYKRTDKMIDANMVANQIIEVITSGISSDINSRNYKSYYNNFFYEGITNTQFELHLYDDGLPGVKEYSSNRKAYDIRTCTKRTDCRNPTSDSGNNHGSSSVKERKKCINNSR